MSLITTNRNICQPFFSDLEVAVRYEGSDDTNDFLPEAQLGGVVSYGLFENTSLALELLHGEFENNDERELLTAQLALEF